MKCKCTNNIYAVQIIPCCDNCAENGAFYEGTYIYDEKIIFEKAILRTQVQDEGECNFGSAFNAGCYMFTCIECGEKRNLALIEGC